MSRNLVVTIVVIVVVLGLGWWFLGRQKQTDVTPSGTTSPQASQSASPSASSSAMMEKGEEIKVSGGDFTFTPSKLTAKKGEKVTLTFQNTGKFPHNLTIDKLGIATKTIGPGESDSVEFTPDQTGTFAIYCSVGNHRQKGMEGTLLIQ